MDCLIHSFGLSFILGLLFAFWFRNYKKNKTVCIVIFGDVGRSPRMQYHAISFVRNGYFVEIVGYFDSPLFGELQDDSKVKIYNLYNPPNLNSLSKMFSYVFKVIVQSFNLLYILFLKCHSNFLILQNPPAIPTMPICWFYCCITKTQFVIDWHNYAYTVMGLSLPKKHIVVKLTTMIESFFGRKAKYNFCVTKAMQEDLYKKWNISAKVLYDRPSENFHPISLIEKHEFLLELSKSYIIFKSHKENSTIFSTKLANGEIKLLLDRPGLVVSSTSWTKDEDFSILFEAFDDYDTECKINNHMKLPNLICIISGKGPLKEFYSAIIKNKNWTHIRIITLWLKNEDYPKLLASADLGVCLHVSSSGLDLPMKIVDMFGCGLPVCAYNYKCLHELVKDNKNSFIFSNAKELTEQLKSWFENFSVNFKHQRHIQFQNELLLFQQIQWHSNWTQEVLPCFEI